MPKCSCCNAPSYEIQKATEARLDQCLTALSRIRFFKLDKDAPEDVQTAVNELQAIAKEAMKNG